MSQNLTEIVQPLVEKGQFEDAETAVRNLMSEYVLHQIEHYRNVLQEYEKKYGMNYVQFNGYLEARAKKLENDSSLHEALMIEEEDALEWKIATEMLESWLGLRSKPDR